MTRTDADQQLGYLHVMAQFGAIGAPQRWNAYVVCDESPRITLAGTVASYDDAHRLASKEQRSLHVAAAAWQQMVAARVAPANPPKDVIIA